MAIIDSYTWYNNKNVGWTNVKGAGFLGFGSGYDDVFEECNQKWIRGQGISIDNLGFYRTNGAASVTDRFFQMDILIPENMSAIIAEVTLSKTAALTGFTSPSVLFRGPPNNDIRLLDNTGSPVAGGSGLSAVQRGGRYTCKFKINSDGTCTGYVDGAGNSNHELGTTSLETGMNNTTLYMQAQITLMSPANGITKFDDYYVHDDGLTFVKPDSGQLDLETFKFSLKSKFPSTEVKATHFEGIYEKDRNDK